MTSAMNDGIVSRNFFGHFKNVFDPQLIRTLRDEAVSYNDEDHLKSAKESSALKKDMGLATDITRLRMRWFDLWRSAKRLPEIFGPYQWIIYPIQIRLLETEAQMVPWHQDAGYQKRMGARAHPRVVTCFIPLEDEPSKYATLAFAKKASGELEHNQVSFHGAVLKEKSFDFTYFNLDLGDCLVFGDHAIHQTYLPPGATLKRRTFEVRHVAPAEALLDKDYFDLERMELVRKPHQ